MPGATEQDYVTLFLESAFFAKNPLAPLSLLLLFMGRFLPIIALSPFFGARVLPHPVKICFSVCMFVIFLPHLLQVTTTPLEYNTFLVLLLFKEILVGFILGFLISIPFNIVQSAGIVIDHQRGGASLMVNDPTIQNQSSPLGTLFNYVLIFIFFTINGPFLFIEALISSYDIVPPDQFIQPYFFASTSPFWKELIAVLQKMMTISLQMASPALLAILMTDFFLGIANRLAPQVQITFLGMPLKSLLGLTVVCFGWNLMAGEMSHQSYYWLNVIKETLLMFRETNP